MKDLREVNCSDVLEDIDPPFPALLIDKRIIEGLNTNKCEATFAKIRIGVDMELLKSVQNSTHPNFEIVYYENFTEKDHILFYDSPTRIIPRMSEERVSVTLLNLISVLIE
ncbi:hypothetical protein KIN20_006908 [Parelaphostrongylus tenuis]|uniref:W02B3.4-like N-terminal domain-containing protein n=1 Tax=Parelaphostrongylus tenuis TaxID=148309 RepID=A0AAD5MKS1_PARTN|nr:hypothetical protein KIN20_006908 [Parelaphostrongylus tenuis]